MVENSPDHVCCLPKNLSYEGNYHSLFYPRLVFERLRCRLRMQESTSSATLEPSENDIDSNDATQASFILTKQPTFSLNEVDKLAVNEELDRLIDEMASSGSASCSVNNEGGKLISKEVSEYGTVSTTAITIVNSSALSSERNCVSDTHLDSKSEMSTEAALEQLEKSISEMALDKDKSDHANYQVTDFEFLEKEPVRRSRSLKTNKTPPGTPHRKKAVRFADALGLDLESVRTIMNNDNPPRIPLSATKDLKINKPMNQNLNDIGRCYLRTCFSQPGCISDFHDRVRSGKVCLENCIIDGMTVTGTVRVANISFHKHVIIRYTFNNWVTHFDINACYVQNSNDGPTDRFSFSFTVPSYFNTGSNVMFALMYNSEVGIFWDNNFNQNYIIECYANPLSNDSDYLTQVTFM